MRLAVTTCLMLCFFAPVAGAQSATGVDLILPPQLESPDAPFYRGAKVSVDGDVMQIREVEMPRGALAEFHPELKAILVSNSQSISEAKKAQALMDVLSALDAGTIATAAGPVTE